MKQKPVFARIYTQGKVFYAVDSPPVIHTGDPILRCRATYALEVLEDDRPVYAQPRLIIVAGTYILEYCDGEVWVENG
jgi:hypothetical protein